MADNLPTIWDLEPHTKAKHAILRKYLEKWMIILSRQSASVSGASGSSDSKRILYFDGFAGPGIYKGGEPGSPIIAIDAAINHSHDFPYPVEMLFIEERKARFENLERVVNSKKSSTVNLKNLHLVNLKQGDCDQVLGELLDEHKNHGYEFGPALAFLDQFGYGSVSMELISKIMAFNRCEVFMYLNYAFMNRFIGDSHKADAMNRAFGSDEWKQCIDLPEQQRRDKLLEIYKSALHKKGNTEYVASFLMYDEFNVPLYWLIFGTNNLRGLEEMKSAMWSVDDSGSFKFSDRDQPGQLKFLNLNYGDAWLAKELRDRLRGKKMTFAEVREFVLVNTPCFKMKSALKNLEMSGDIVVTGPSKRKKGTFTEDLWKQIFITFPTENKKSQKTMFGF